MKNLIKASLLAVALLLASAVSAQLLPVSLGVKGGITRSDLSPKEFDSKSGFNAGLTFDLNLPANFVILSGLEVNTKGAIDEFDLKRNMMYLQLPARLGYRLKLLPGLRAHFGFGPYFAQGIGGKSTIAGVPSNIKDDTFGSKDYQYRKFDWGLGMEVGVTLLGHVQIRTGYDFGLKNIARTGDSVKNRNFYVSAGLLFF